jgi:hypothetical protein
MLLATTVVVITPIALEVTVPVLIKVLHQQKKNIWPGLAGHPNLS